MVCARGYYGMYFFIPTLKLLGGVREVGVGVPEADKR